MEHWYDKYMTIYGKPFSEVPQHIVDETRERLARDLFLWVQHFKRPELSVRGLVFAYNADYGRKEPYRVDIIHGEDESMKYGRIVFVRDRLCRAITGYGTIGQQYMWQSFVDHVKVQMKGIGRIFYKTDHYEDEALRKELGTNARKNVLLFSREKIMN